jgi:RHS repeat-associated protein
VRAVGTEGLLDAVGQIVLQFDDNAQGDPQLTHRYLWGPAVDQILADEQVTDVVQEGNILWPLTDHLGTVRDLAEYDNVTDTTTVQNHRTYNAFGQLISETNAAVDHLFAFTGRATDESTGLQNNLNRWYDAAVGRWLSQDPIAFGGGDANLYRYVRSGPLSAIDPTGLDDIRINKLIANVVQWMPEGWFNRDQPWGAVDIGTVDRHGVVTFFSQYKLNPMPLSILKEYGGADTIGELIANLRKAQAANPKNIWSGGQSVADYWSLRLTQAEINKWGEEAAVKAANDRILKRALALAGLEQGYSTVEGGAGVVLGGLGTIALLNSWNPVGWGCLIAAAGIGGKGVKDYTDTWDIQRAGSDAARYYCNPDALVP